MGWWWCTGTCESVGLNSYISTSSTPDKGQEERWLPAIRVLEQHKAGKGAHRKLKRTEIHSKDSKLTTHFEKVAVSEWLLRMSILFSWDRRINMCWLGFISSLFHKIIPYKLSVKKGCIQAYLVKMVLCRSRKVRWHDIIQQKHSELTLAVQSMAVTDFGPKMAG